MRKTMLATAIVLMAWAGTASAVEAEVKMPDRDAEGVMISEPSLVKVAPGDTVKFVAADKLRSQTR